MKRKENQSDTKWKPARADATGPPNRGQSKVRRANNGKWLQHAGGGEVNSRERKTKLER